MPQFIDDIIEGRKTMQDEAVERIREAFPLPAAVDYSQPDLKQRGMYVVTASKTLPLSKLKEIGFSETSLAKLSVRDVSEWQVPADVMEKKFSGVRGMTPEQITTALRKIPEHRYSRVVKAPETDNPFYELHVAGVVTRETIADSEQDKGRIKRYHTDLQQIYIPEKQMLTAIVEGSAAGGQAIAEVKKKFGSTVNGYFVPGTVKGRGTYVLETESTFSPSFLSQLGIPQQQANTLDASAVQLLTVPARVLENAVPGGTQMSGRRLTAQLRKIPGLEFSKLLNDPSETKPVVLMTRAGVSRETLVGKGGDKQQIRLRGVPGQQLIYVPEQMLHKALGIEESRGVG